MIEMTPLEQLQSLYETYEQQAQAAKKKSSIFAGILGSGNDHRNHPCHDQFYQDVGKVIHSFLEESPDAAAVGPVLRWVLMEASRHKEQVTFGYLYALHNYAEDLIALADPAECAQLYAQYNQVYPRIERMPVQQKVYKALGKRAKKG